MPTKIKQQDSVHDVPKDIRKSLLDNIKSSNIINSKAVLLSGVEAHPPTFTCLEKRYVKGDIALITHAKGKTVNNKKDEVNRV